MTLVGPIDSNNQGFKDFVDKYFNEHPNLKNRIKFLGEINNREKLISIYENSKIFVLPSRYESFGIALIEAELHGDFIICTDIPSFRANTDNYRFAYSFSPDDQQTLEEHLVKACNTSNIENKARLGYEYAVYNYNLKRVCDKICKNVGY